MLVAAVPVAAEPIVAEPVMAVPAAAEPAPAEPVPSSGEDSDCESQVSDSASHEFDEIEAPATGEPLPATPRPSPEELMTMAGRCVGEMGSIANMAFAVAQRAGAQAHAAGYLVWQMSETIRDLLAELEERPVLPPLPRAAQRIVDAAISGDIELCEHCRAWRNVELDDDGRYTQIFCKHCCELAAARHHCRACDERVYVDLLGEPAPYCKDCANKNRCATPGCLRDARGQPNGLCNTCFNKQRPSRRR